MPKTQEKDQNPQGKKPQGKKPKMPAYNTTDRYDAKEEIRRAIKERGER